MLGDTPESRVRADSLWCLHWCLRRPAGALHVRGELVPHVVQEPIGQLNIWQEIAALGLDGLLLQVVQGRVERGVHERAFLTPALQSLPSRQDVS